MLFIRISRKIKNLSTKADLIWWGIFQLAVLKGPCAGRQHLVIFNQNIGAPSELERFLPPSLKLVIVNDLIIDELEVVRGNGEQQRHIERLENIIFYQHIAMIVIPLLVQLLDFRVNGNDGIRKLVTRGQVINECILRITTSWQAPLSYHPWASPANRMAEPEEWSNKLPSTSTLSGVVKRDPLARLLRTILLRKTTEG